MTQTGLRFLAVLLIVSCSSETPRSPKSVPMDAGASAGSPELSLEQRLDPLGCRDCHPTEYDQWSSSMHAYGSLSPVFLAMNRRAQRLSKGKLGDYCVRCHAPLALELGLTKDGLNLDDVPAYAQGITCYFCHSIERMTGNHDDPWVLSRDGPLKTGQKMPSSSPNAHGVAYSPWLDSQSPDSSGLCGGCHRMAHSLVDEPSGPLADWQQSIYASEGEDFQTCGDCHMRLVSIQSVPTAPMSKATVRSHTMVGFSGPLEAFPFKDENQKEIQRDLNRSVAAQLCVRATETGSEIEVILENLAVGHAFPSSGSIFRRLWVEIVAYDATDSEIFSSGVLGDDEALIESSDHQIWALHALGLDERGGVAFHIEDVDRIKERSLPPLTSDASVNEGIDIHRRHTYVLAEHIPAYVSLRVRLRPMGLDVLDVLIGDGDLEAHYRMLVPTFDLGLTRLDWAAEDGKTCIPAGHMEPY